MPAAGRPPPARSSGSAAAASTRFRSAASSRPRSPRRAPWTAGAKRTPRSAGCRSRATSRPPSRFARDGFPVTSSPRHVDRGPRRRCSPSSAGGRRHLSPGRRLAGGRAAPAQSGSRARLSSGSAHSAARASTRERPARELARFSRGQRRLLHRARSRRAACALGRAGVDDLSRGDDLRDAAADPGALGAADAQPHRAL